VGYRKTRSSILSLIGNTPLLRIHKVLPPDISPDVEIYAKLESFNPGGSVKDRAALSIALAMVGSAMGVPQGWRYGTRPVEG